MKKANYIGLDCETGGLDHEKNPITQIALLAIDSSTLEEINRFEFFIKPYDDLKIEKEALDATGLKMVDINNGHDKKKAVKLITDFAKEISPNSRPENRPIMIGHNVQFDIGFIDYLFKSVGKDIYKVFSRTFECTMLQTKKFNPSASSLKLGKCCEAVGIDLADAHKAMNDTVATVELFKHYVNKLRAKGGTANATIKQSKKSRLKFQF